ncbi:MAG: hypothetical protein WKG07_32210 [Hymenobacter sp.]
MLTQDALLAKLNRNSNYLLANSVYEREHLAWPAYRYQAAQLAYPATWLASRLAYLGDLLPAAGKLFIGYQNGGQRNPPATVPQPGERHAERRIQHRPVPVAGAGPERPDPAAS